MRNVLKLGLHQIASGGRCTENFRAQRKIRQQIELNLSGSSSQILPILRSPPPSFHASPAAAAWRADSDRSRWFLE
jgi:hypothetical protein